MENLEEWEKEYKQDARKRMEKALGEIKDNSRNTILLLNLISAIID